MRHPLVFVLGVGLLLVGAGMAAARTQGGPPWAQAPDCETTTTDTTTTDADTELAAECEPEDLTEAAGDDVVGDGVVVLEEPVQEDVEAFFAEFDNECGAAFLGEFDLADEDTLVAFDDLITRLEGGQTSHGIQGIRSVMRNCEDHPNDGLMNALYHHGLNWVKHYEHEQWLQEKFADKWPDGKPGNGGAHGNPHESHGNPHESHGNPHTGSSGGSHGNGNGYGHST